MIALSLTNASVTFEPSCCLLAKDGSSRATLHAFGGAKGRGLRAFGLFYSLVLNFDHFLLPVVEMGRAVFVRDARPLYVNSRCACDATQAGDCPICGLGGLS